MSEWIKNIKTKIKPYDLPWLFLFFVIPVFPSLISSAIVLIILSLIVDYKSCKFNFSENKLLVLPVLLYFAYMLGLLFTDTDGMKAIVAERKLSLFIFPVIFLFKRNFDLSFRKYLWNSFFAGLLLYILLSLLGAIEGYFRSGDINSFFSSAFSYDLHPSYSALYLCIAILYMLFNFIDYSNHYTLKNKVLLVITIIIFSAVVFLLSSKAGIISFILVIISSLIYFGIKHKKLYYLIVFSVLIVMIFSILLYLNPVPFQRFRGMFETSSLTNEQLFKEHHRSTESNVVRRMIWTVSGEIISDNPFGVGSGDANTELLKKYRQYDMTGALSKELNAHNQFIQTTLALGYPGLLLLIALFIFPLLNSFKNKNYLLFIFLVITTINVAVESMFETESGIVFIILFYCFLLSEKEKITKFNS